MGKRKQEFRKMEKKIKKRLLVLDVEEELHEIWVKMKNYPDIDVRLKKEEVVLVREVNTGIKLVYDDATCSIGHALAKKKPPDKPVSKTKRRKAMELIYGNILLVNQTSSSRNILCEKIQLAQTTW
jgi:hypothetical protein